MAETAILQTLNLTKTFGRKSVFFRGKQSENVAVDNVSLTLAKGETLGIVGESGCGKSTLARTVIRLYEPTGGTILFDGTDITRTGERELKTVRRRLQMIFQDPLAALDARLTIEQIIAEPLDIHRVGTKTERIAAVVNLLERVGLRGADRHRFSNEFSGGQQQRIGIARALALRPDAIICDEPVSALDVSVQAQILNLLRDLQDEMGLSLLFISHNIAVTAFVSRRIGVMYGGRLIEIGGAGEIVAAPRHPYTQALIAAIPRFAASPRGENSKIAGEADDSAANDAGCNFRRRCPLAQKICAEEKPELRLIGENHRAACHFA